MRIIFPIILLGIFYLDIHSIYARNIHGECSNECGRWAFGSDYQVLSNEQFVTAWNKRWGKLFEMSPTDVIYKDMKEVNRLYHASEGV